MRVRTDNHPLPLRLMALCATAALAATGCGADPSGSSGPSDPSEPRPVAEEPRDDRNGSGWAEVDLDELVAACTDIESHMDAVDTAAQGLEQDILIDGGPYQEQHAYELSAHLDDVERLEEALSGTGLGDEATERADAVDAVLEELDFGDEAGLDEALTLVSDTRDPLLEFCEP